MIKLHCKHCGYNWLYKGKADFYAGCPRCHYLVKLPHEKVKEGENAKTS